MTKDIIEVPLDYYTPLYQNKKKLASAFEGIKGKVRNYKVYFVLYFILLLKKENKARILELILIFLSSSASTDTVISIEI